MPIQVLAEAWSLRRHTGCAKLHVLQELWIIGVLASHLLLLLSVLVFRKSWNLNLIIMVSAGEHLTHPYLQQLTVLCNHYTLPKSVQRNKGIERLCGRPPSR